MKSIQEKFQDAAKEAEIKKVDKIIGKFLKKLPRQIEKHYKKVQAGKIKNTESLMLELPKDITNEIILSSSAYQALHAYCAQEDINIRIDCKIILKELWIWPDSKYNKSIHDTGLNQWITPDELKKLFNNTDNPKANPSPRA